MAVVKSIREQLEKARKELLDLSARNRLLNTPRGKARAKSIEIFDELSDQVYRLLVLNKKAMGFLPAATADDGDESTSSNDGVESTLAQPDDEEVDESGIAKRHTDSLLQTHLSSEKLQKRLLSIFYDARTFEEEQGVNILYLALGFLKWFEADSSDRPRFAPLILLPVSLERQSANARFKVSLREEDISTNLSLQAKLKDEFGRTLPEISEVEEFSTADYFDAVRRVIVDRPRWEVDDNGIVLGFFSFSKFLMFRDLDPATWSGDKRLDEHPLITALLQKGFSHEPTICGDDDSIDAIIHPVDMVHVVDADSSQALVIEEARKRRNLVIQGPPGTGKSQTIANLIAAAVKDGKSVLFVAEKMAALEVVKRRLDHRGLGAMCLELHSHKANKRAVLADLGQTLGLGRPKMPDVNRLVGQLAGMRDQLNAYVSAMHHPIARSERTPYQAIGEAIRLRAEGVSPGPFKLNRAALWTAVQFREKNSLVTDLSLQLGELGNPRQHAWRGVRRPNMLPMDIDRLIALLGRARAEVHQLLEAVETLTSRLRVGLADTLNAVVTVHRLGSRLASAPNIDRAAIADDVWNHSRAEIAALVQDGRCYAEYHAKLHAIVHASAWSVDWTAERRHLAAHGNSWFRWFNSDYRRAQATLRGVLLVDMPQPLAERLSIIDMLMSGQQALWSVSVHQGNSELGRRAFGSLWNGAQSDWELLSAIDQWEAECRAAKVPTSFRLVLSRLHDVEPLTGLLKAIAALLKPAHEHIKEVVAELKLDLVEAFGVAEVSQLPLSVICERFDTWITQRELLSKWVQYYALWSRLQSDGLQELASRLQAGQTDCRQILNQFNLAYCEELLREAFRSLPMLANFNGQSHQQVMDGFRKLDLQRLEMARLEVALAHYERIPKAEGGVGEVGTVQREVAKKRGHKQIRKLLKEAGHAVQAIKPVFMMSPVSVAQFLEPGVLEFDLLLIDEASQVRPVDALGAISRVRQFVVVGDEKQLPPTRFFDKVLGDDDEEEVDQPVTANLESILGLCVSQGVAKRMLRWHYRSRHHSLIAVSNREFYRDKLFVVPSPAIATEEQGLKFRHVQNGVYDRSGTATNRVEAKAVAEAVMRHARIVPQQSLGVGAFSVAQRDAIIDELELLRRHEPATEVFFGAGTPEPFFVKNLENIQGDERDVIFISVGYGRDSSGYMAMSFGPLAGDGGERRLNVLITRARERCEVFSSITADDIDLNRAKSKGAEKFKTFLKYAQSGILDATSISGREPDSDFELEVARALGNHGYRIDSQVGVAGFFIDLAVIDPEKTGRYILGIECDGATYHRARSARDRDRLRQTVLEDHGWTVHRIWSTDWFHRPEEQLRKTLLAIEQARIAKPEEAAAPATAVADSTSIERIAAVVATSSSGRPTIPYTEARFAISESKPIHETSTDRLSMYVLAVVRAESPIHQEEIVRRVVSLWGNKRNSARSAEAIETSLGELSWRKQIYREGAFVQAAGQIDATVRDRSAVGSASLRKPEMLPPREVQAALVSIAKTHVGVNNADAAVEVARMMGLGACTSAVKGVVNREIEKLVTDGGLSRKNDKLYGIE